MDLLTNLRTFLAVSRSGGFSDAARQLHVVPSVVAKRVAQLERTVQARLFERSTRSVTLTEAGQQLQARAAALVADLDDVVDAVRRDEGELEGHIRLMAPTTLTFYRLGAILDAFLAAHERITLEVALVDRSINPAEEGYDLAISGRSASYEGVLDLPLCPVRPTLCAAPAYLARRGMPAHPRELGTHDCLVFKPGGGLWVFQSPRGIVQVEVTGRLLADDNHTLLLAATRGRGIALLPGYICAPALSAGELRTVLDAYPLQDAWFKAYVPRRRHGLTRVRALLQWLGTHLDESSPAGAERA